MTPQNKGLNYLVRSGLFLFCLAGLSRLFLHPAPGLPATMIEFATGFLFGISVVFLLGGLALENRDQHCLLETNPMEPQK